MRKSANSKRNSLSREFWEENSEGGDGKNENACRQSGNWWNVWGEVGIGRLIFASRVSVSESQREVIPEKLWVR